MESRQQVYFWKGVIDPQGFTEANVIKNNLVKNVLMRLLAGEYSELNLERLRGHNVFSVRLNKADRMLFTTVNVDGVSHIMVLDVVLNHDYDKSPFLKPAVLRNYLLRTEDSIVDRVVAVGDFDNEENVQADLPRGYDYDLKAAEYFNHQFIEFSGNQNETVTATLPLAISGAAGSGKSCVALSLIANHATKFVNETCAPILYVAKSESLCRSMERDWLSTPLAQHFTEGQIQFVSYDKLIANIDPNVCITFAADTKSVTANNADVRVLESSGFEKFCEFIKVRYDHQRSVDKSKRSNKAHVAIRESFIEKLEMLYQEFRAISGCMNDIEIYRNLGSDQTLLAKETKEQIAEREWLFKQYPAYQKYLETKGSVDIAFYQPNVKACYELIVVDETQDLSHVQIAVLGELALEKRICLCEDARQSLSEILAKRTYFSRVLPGISIKTLAGSYRCPNQVLNMANTAMKLATLTTGHKLPEVSLSDNNNGHVRLLTKLTPELQEECREAAKSPDFAVVTLNGYVNEAIEKFGTQLVMTVEEIKGFQYRHVLVYRLLDGDLYYDANAVLDTKRKLPTNEKFGPAFNALYTACTRAMETLTIVQGNGNNKLTHILAQLEAALPSQMLASVKSMHAKSTHTDQDWLVQIRMHLDKGQELLAEKIATKTLQWTGDAYKKFRNDYLMVAPVAEVAMPVATVSTPVKSKSRRALSVVELQRELLNAPSDELLKKFFNYKDAGKYLFEGLEADTCLFTELCENSAIRPVLLETYFTKHFETLMPYFTQAAFVGVKSAVGYNNGKMPGIYWLATNAKCMSTLARSKKFADFITNYANMHALTIAPASLDKPTALYALSCYPSGIRTLHHVLTTRKTTAGFITADLLLRKFTNTYSVGLQTSFFQNLLTGGEVALDILIIIMTVQGGLAGSVKLADLFPQHAGFQPPLYTVMTSLKGIAFIRQLQKLNPHMTGMALHEVDIHVLQELESQCLDRADSFEVQTFESLMANPTGNNLTTILLNESFARKLFTPKDKECLFVTIFDDPALRANMLTAIMLTSGGVLREVVTVAGLCRNQRSETEVPPLVWMVCNERLTSIVSTWLSDDEMLKSLPSEALTHHVSIGNYLRAQLPSTASAMHGESYLPLVHPNYMVNVVGLLLMTAAGRSIMARIAGLKQIIPVGALNEIAYIRVRDKCKVSLFTLLSENIDDGHRILQGMLLMLRDKNLDVDTICEEILNDNTCATLAYNLSASSNAIDCLFYLATGSKLAFSDVASELLVPFMRHKVANENQINVFARFKRICEYENGMLIFLNLVKSNPVLVENFNSSLFLNDISHLKDQERDVAIAMQASEAGRQFRKLVIKYFVRFPVMEPTSAREEFDSACSAAKRCNRNEFNERYPLPPAYINILGCPEHYADHAVISAFEDITPIEKLAADGEHESVRFILSHYLNPNVTVDYNEGRIFDLFTHAIRGYLRSGNHLIANLYIDQISPKLDAASKESLNEVIYSAYLASGNERKLKLLTKIKPFSVAKLTALQMGQEGKLHKIKKYIATLVDKEAYKVAVTFAAYGMAKCLSISDQRSSECVEELLKLGARPEKVAQGYISVGRGEQALNLLVRGLALGEVAYWACVSNDLPLLEHLFNVANDEQKVELLRGSIKRLLPCIAYSFLEKIPNIMMKTLAIMILYISYLERGLFHEIAYLQKRYSEIINYQGDSKDLLRSGWITYFTELLIDKDRDEQLALIEMALAERKNMEVPVTDLCYLAHIDDQQIRDLFAQQMGVHEPQAGFINRLMHRFKIQFVNALDLSSMPKTKLLPLDNQLSINALFTVRPELLIWLLQGSKCFAERPELFLLITRWLTGLPGNEVLEVHEVFSRRVYGVRHLTMFQVREEASSDVPACVPGF